MGSRCSGLGSVFGSAGCSDIHPGAFHLALTNQIGLMNQGFVADVDSGSEVWNQPVFGYESRILQESSSRRGAARGTVREVMVETRMLFALESPQQWEPVLGTDKFGQDSKVYTYWLELSSTGEVLGGSWVTSSRPDFIWTTTKSEFRGAFEGLRQIYRPLGRQPGVPFP